MLFRRRFFSHSDSFCFHTKTRISSHTCQGGPSPVLLCSPLPPTTFSVPGTYNRTWKTTVGLFLLKGGGRQRDQNPREEAWLQSSAWDVILNTLLVSLLCTFNAPTKVVLEGCKEHGCTPMADVLPTILALLCCLASWRKAPWWAKWLLVLWLAKIQDVNLIVCYGYFALFQDVILYLYSTNQMLFR